MPVPMGAQVPVLAHNDNPNPCSGQRKGFIKNRILRNSIAFGKSTPQRIYPKQYTPKIGYKLHSYRHALHILDDHFK